VDHSNFYILFASHSIIYVYISLFQNIVRDFNIDYTTKRHANDAISIHLWVEEMKKLESKCSVIYYKGQDKEHFLDKNDFVLILMTNLQEC